MTPYRLVELTPDNVERACRLTLAPGQERWVEPVAWSIAEAYVHGPVAWPRLVLAGPGDDAPAVGFVMAFLDIEWDPEASPGLRRSGIWRLNVDAAHQGRGVGRFAVAAVVDEIARRGLGPAHVTWSPDPDGPEGFWLGRGFEVLDELAGQERVGRLPLAAPHP